MKKLVFLRVRSGGRSGTPFLMIFDRFGVQGGSQEPPKTGLGAIFGGIEFWVAFWVKKVNRVFMTGGVPLIN